MYEAFAQGRAKEPRFHPTYKPISLYKDILADFAKPGDKVLDSHVGSASSLIACYEMGFDAWGYEIDEYYFKKASERLASEMAQVRMEI